MKRTLHLKTAAAVVLLAVGLIAAGLGRAAEDPGQSDETKSYQQAYTLILAEKWGEAKAALNVFLRQYPKSSWADDARYWLCYSREQNDENRVEIDVPHPVEDRRVILGKIQGKVWAGVYTLRGDSIRIISVRRARSKEVRLYEEKTVR